MPWPSHRMKVSVTFEVDDGYRRAILHYYDDAATGRADRKAVEGWFRMFGDSMNDDLRLAHGKCCWGDAETGEDE